MNQSARFLGQMSFRSEVIVQTQRHTDTHIGSIALPGPLKQLAVCTPPRHKVVTSEAVTEEVICHYCVILQTVSKGLFYLFHLNTVSGERSSSTLFLRKRSFIDFMLRMMTLLAFSASFFDGNAF